MKTNKKEIVIGIVIIVLIATIGITYGLSKSGSKANEPKKTEKTARRDDKKKAPKGEIKKEAEVKQEEAKSTDKAESPAPTIKKEETVNKPSKSTAKQSATGNATSKPAAKPATKTPRWVVDRAAWTETKQVPVYDYVYVYKVYGVKADKTTEYIGNYYSYDEACAAMDNFDRSKYVTTGYASNLEEKLIRTDTQTINHPEEGHWEY